MPLVAPSQSACPNTCPAGRSASVGQAPVQAQFPHPESKALRGAVPPAVGSREGGHTASLDFGKQSGQVGFGFVYADEFRGFSPGRQANITDSIDLASETKFATPSQSGDPFGRAGVTCSHSTPSEGRSGRPPSGPPMLPYMNANPRSLCALPTPSLFRIRSSTVSDSPSAADTRMCSIRARPGTGVR